MGSPTVGPKSPTVSLKRKRVSHESTATINDATEPSTPLTLKEAKRAKKQRKGERHATAVAAAATKQPGKKQLKKMARMARKEARIAGEEGGTKEEKVTEEGQVTKTESAIEDKTPTKKKRAIEEKTPIKKETSTRKERATRRTAERNTKESLRTRHTSTPGEVSSSLNSSVPSAKVVDFYNLHRWLYKAQVGQIYTPVSGTGTLKFTCTNGLPRMMLSQPAYVVVMENVPSPAKPVDIAKLIQPYEFVRAFFPTIPKGGSVRRIVVCASLPASISDFPELPNVHYGGLSINTFTLGNCGNPEHIGNPLPIIYKKLRDLKLSHVRPIGDGEWYTKKLPFRYLKGEALIWTVNQDDFRAPVKKVNDSMFENNQMSVFWREVTGAMVLHIARHALQGLVHINVAEMGGHGAWVSCLFESPEAAGAAEKALESQPVRMGRYKMRVQFGRQAPPQLAAILVTKKKKGSLLGAATDHPEMGTVLMEGEMQKLYEGTLEIPDECILTGLEKEACRLLRTPEFLTPKVRNAMWRAVTSNFRVPKPTDGSAVLPAELEEENNEPEVIDLEDDSAVNSEGRSAPTRMDQSSDTPRKDSKVMIGPESNIIVIDGDSSPAASVPKQHIEPVNETIQDPTPPEFHLKQLDFIEGRYSNLFSDSPICGICFGANHKTADCSLRTCSHCKALDTHFSFACPSLTRCTKCREIKTSYSAPCACLPLETLKPKPCGLCKRMTSSHTESTCPSLWRRDSYRISKKPESSTRAMLTFCYGCGNGKHFGMNCPSVPRSIALHQGGSCDTFSDAFADFYRQSTGGSAARRFSGAGVLLEVEDQSRSFVEHRNAAQRQLGVKSHRRFLDDTDSSDLEEYQRQVDEAGEYKTHKHWDDENDDPFANLGRSRREPKPANGISDQRTSEPESIVPGSKWASSHLRSAASVIAKKTITINLDSIRNMIPPSNAGNQDSENTFIPPPISDMMVLPSAPPPPPPSQMAYSPAPNTGRNRMGNGGRGGSFRGRGIQTRRGRY